MTLREIQDEAVQRARAELPEPIALNTHQSAAYAGFTRRQLEHWRSRGGGPPFIKIGRHVRYRLRDLDAHMDARRVANTAQEVKP